MEGSKGEEEEQRTWLMKSVITEAVIWSKSFEATEIISDNPTKHEEEEYDYLQVLAEINHLASGGAIVNTNSYRFLDDSSFLARFRSPLENTLLHIAAKHGNDELVDLVMAKQQQSNNDDIILFSFNKNRDTPLHLAAKYGQISTLGKLLQAAVCCERVVELIGMKNDQGNNVLHEAMICGGSMASMIFHVLETFNSEGYCYELALNDVNNGHKSVLCLAVEGRHVEAVSRILDKCSQSATPKGISPLVAALIKTDADLVRMIVSKKQEWIHLKDMNERLPLHCPASIGYQGGVAYLLEKCKNCSMERDKYGMLPLHLAASRGHVAAMKELLSYCPNPEEMLDPFGRNILHLAAINKWPYAVRYILGTPTLEKMINQKNELGGTPLHDATFFRSPLVVHAVTWDSRVDLNMLDRNNHTALNIAETQYVKDPSIRQLLTWTTLRSAGAKGSPNYRVNQDFDTSSSSSSNERNMERYLEMRSREVETLSVISTLIVTASVAACLAVPGEAQGTAYNLKRPMFQFFIFCITISFFTSLSATVILLWLRKGEGIYLIESGLMWTKALIGTALILLASAFTAGLYTVISKLTWLATTFGSITFIFLVFLCLLYSFLLFPSLLVFPSLLLPLRPKILGYINHIQFICWELILKLS